MAMILYPNILKQAQSEIDSVVGEDGLSMPTFEQFDKLPYCSAVVKEVFR